MPFIKVDDIHVEYEKQRELLDLCFSKIQHEQDDSALAQIMMEDKSMSLEDNMETWEDVIQFVKENPDCSLDDIFDYYLTLFEPLVLLDVEKWIKETFVPQIENEEQRQEFDALMAWLDQGDEDDEERWDILLDFAYDDPNVSLKDLLHLYHRIKNEI